MDPGSLERLLRARLEGSGFFGARFRESAGRALLLPRASARKRTPLWLTRQRAKSLFAAVARFEDFPLLLEAWRTCLRDEFDLEHLRVVLDELEAGTIRVSEVSTPAPSPFCGELVWKQTNTLMYEDDAPGRGTRRRTSAATSCGSSPFRPTCGRGSTPRSSPAFQEKLQRTAAGYAPRDSRELLDWVKERVLIPAEEWEALLAACERDTGLPRGELLAPLAGKIVEQVSGGTGADGSAGSRALSRWSSCRACGGAPRAGDEETREALIMEWLRFYGPIEPSFLARTFGLPGDLLDSILEDLAEEEQVVLDRLAADSERPPSLRQGEPGDPSADLPCPRASPGPHAARRGAAALHRAAAGAHAQGSVP